MFNRILGTPPYLLKFPQDHHAVLVDADNNPILLLFMPIIDFAAPDMDMFKHRCELLLDTLSRATQPALDCLVCKEVFPINEMYSVDACCEEHQAELDMARANKSLKTDRGARANKGQPSPPSAA